MSNLALAEIIIPIVAGAALFVWIAMVIRADRHPRHGGDAPQSDVTADTIGADGSQVLPTHHNAPAREDVNAPEATGDAPRRSQ
jgi:hypothetical protein